MPIFNPSGVAGATGATGAAGATGSAGAAGAAGVGSPLPVPVGKTVRPTLQGSSSAGNYSFTAGTARAWPFYVDKAMTFDRLYFYVLDLSGGSFTVYNYLHAASDGDAYGIGARVAALGGVTCNAGYTQFALTINTTVQAGWNWLVSAIPAGNNGTFFGAAPNSFLYGLATDVALQHSTVRFSPVSDASSMNADPSTYTRDTLALNIPYFAFRRSA